MIFNSWMPAYTFLNYRLDNWELCPHLVVDLNTLELTSAFLEAAKRAHTLFQHSFFDKGI